MSGRTGHAEDFRGLVAEVTAAAKTGSAREGRAANKESNKMSKKLVRVVCGQPCDEVNHSLHGLFRVSYDGGFWVPRALADELVASGRPASSSRN